MLKREKEEKMTRKEELKEKRQLIKIIGINKSKDERKILENEKIDYFFEYTKKFVILNTIFNYCKGDAEKIYELTNKKIKEIFDNEKPKYLFLNARSTTLHYIFNNNTLLLKLDKPYFLNSSKLIKSDYEECFEIVKNYVEEKTRYVDSLNRKIRDLQEEIDQFILYKEAELITIYGLSMTKEDKTISFILYMKENFGLNLEETKKLIDEVQSTYLSKR